MKSDTLFIPEVAGLRLKMAIEATGVKYTAIAVEIGIARRTLFHWCDGKGFDIQKSERCARYFKIDVNWFSIPKSLFEVTKFISAVQEGYLTSISPISPHEFNFVFSGDDTYSLASFCKLLDEKGLSSETRVSVRGALGESIQTIRGTISSYQIDKYIRNFSLCSQSGQNLSVGGSNATVEDVRANQITLTLEQDNVKALVDSPWYAYCQNNISIIHTDAIEQLIGLGQYTTAIHLLKKKGDIHSLRLLSKIDIAAGVSNAYIPVLCDSFRCFSSIYIHQTAYSEKVTNLMLRRAAKLLEYDETSAAVYCIESAGYAATSPLGFSSVFAFAEALVRNGVSHCDSHIIWATEMSLRQALSANADVMSPEIQNMLEQLRAYRTTETV